MKRKPDNLEKKSLLGTEKISLEIHEGKRNYLNNRFKKNEKSLLSRAKAIKKVAEGKPEECECQAGAQAIASACVLVVLYPIKNVQQKSPGRFVL